jgi:hypothetical protein
MATYHSYEWSQPLKPHDKPFYKIQECNCVYKMRGIIFVPQRFGNHYKLHQCDDKIPKLIVNGADSALSSWEVASWAVLERGLKQGGDRGGCRGLESTATAVGQSSGLFEQPISHRCTVPFLSQTTAMEALAFSGGFCSLYCLPIVQEGDLDHRWHTQVLLIGDWILASRIIGIIRENLPETHLHRDKMDVKPGVKKFKNCKPYLFPLA